MADGGEGKTAISGIQIKINGNEHRRTRKKKKKKRILLKQQLFFGNFLFEGIYLNCTGLLYIS